MDDTKARLRLDHLLAALLLFAMAAIAFVNVLSRYLFHFSFASTEELTINLFVWLTVVGSGIAFERGGHLGMTTFYRVLPDHLKQCVVWLSAGLSALLFILVDLYTIQAIYDEITVFGATSPALGIPVWIYYTGVPVLSVFVFLGVYRDARTKLSDLQRESDT